MKLEDLLTELKNHISQNIEDQEYLSILYGNAWEVQFHTKDKTYVGIHKYSLKSAVKKVLLQLTF